MGLFHCKMAALTLWVTYCDVAARIEDPHSKFHGNLAVPESVSCQNHYNFITMKNNYHEAQNSSQCPVSL